MTLDQFAAGIGYVVMVAGGLGIAGFMSAVVCDYIWTRVRLAYGLAEVVAVMQKHNAKKEQSK